MTKITKLPPAAALTATDLVPVVQNVSTVPTNNKATGLQVQALANTTGYVLPYGTASRANSDRFGEEVHVMEFMSSTWTGGNDCVPAIHAARDVVLARGGGVIVMPPGASRTNSPIDFRPLHGLSYSFRGAGKRVTSLNISHNSGPGIYHGDPTKYGAGRTPAADFSDFAMANNFGLRSDGNPFLQLSSCDEFQARNLHVSGARQLMILGESANIDSVYRSSFKNVFASDDGQVSMFIQIESASAVDFLGDCFFNGSGTKSLFGQLSTATRNFDGLNCGALTAEHWARFLDIQGPGGGNSSFVGGHSDRATDYMVYLAPASGGTLRNVKFVGWIFEALGAGSSPQTDTTQAVKVSGAGVTYDIGFIGCEFLGFGNTTLELGNSTRMRVLGNTFRDCASRVAGTPSIVSVGATGAATIANNTAGLLLAPSLYRGIAWAGSSAPGYRGANNNYWGAPLNADSGTP